MDEPLSNLDAKLRVQMRAEVARLQRDLGVTTIYVTHDQVEAMTMGSRIVVMRKGVLQQVGKPQRLYEEPVNLFVATFIGSPAMNLFRGTVVSQDGGLVCKVGDQQLALRSGTQNNGLGEYVGAEVALGIRPEHLVDPAAADDSWPRLRADVALVEELGAEKLVHFELSAQSVITDEVLEVARDTDATTVRLLREEAEHGRARLVARFGSRSRIERGSHGDVAIDVEFLHFFDLDTGRAIR